ncbi:tetratricopeptide repeat protein [Bacillus infantis]|uniref:Tetratricopeptide repeat protein n=1 Tax=Bacillus infantis TaxID=324767 RepID=A0A5D4RNV8_9BACI|nr:tetratricopeptide repeat protein [Bacillus infantis]TYS52061.1 tetratricopeptide repeat protein [Bacillus infantis]
MEELEFAMYLRGSGELKKSNLILKKLADRNPGDALISYQTAWSFDLLGEEAEAAPYYERAISLGLPDKELEGALLGLGSTYRTLGEYQKARCTLEKGMERFPDNRAMIVFYSMVLYNLGNHGEAMGILLESLAETSSDEGIQQYRKAIFFYADKLDTVWK